MNFFRCWFFKLTIPGTHGKSKKEKPSKKEAFLKKALLDAQRSLQDAYDGLSNVKEPELIDSYIYELNAANLRYQVILRDYKSYKSIK